MGILEISITRSKNIIRISKYNFFLKYKLQLIEQIVSCIFQKNIYNF